MDLNNNIEKEKKYVALLTGVQFFNILDFVILLPLGPILMRYFSIGPSEFAALASSYNISAAITGIIYSCIADHYDRKILLKWMLIFFTLASFSCAFATSFEFLLISRITAGVFGGFITPSVYAIISELIPFQRRGKAMGTIMASFSFTSIIGIPLGLALADYLSWRYTFIFIGIGSTLITLFIQHAFPLIPVSGIKSSATAIIKNIYQISLKKDYHSSFIIMCLYASSGFLLFPFLSPYSVSNVGIDEKDLKILYFIGGLLTVFASKYTGVLVDKIGSFKVYIPTMLASLPFIYLYTSVENISFELFLLISSLFMAVINMRFVPIMTLITQAPNNEDRGGFMGVLLSLRSLFSALATAFAGFIITETKDGKLKHFELAGYLSIILSLIGVFYFFKLHRYIQKGLINDH